MSFVEDFQRECERAGREIKVLAVSKSQSLARIEEFLRSGISFWALGESYLEELEQKQAHFASRTDLAWHFIGRLQSRKIPDLLSRVSVLHSVSRTKELELIATRPREFFLQVNVSDEDSKNGVLPAALPVLVERIDELGLSAHCRGLMGLPSPLASVGEVGVRREMVRLRTLRDKHLPAGLLNMGTSDDYPIAIGEGADVVRIGSLLFGER